MQLTRFGHSCVRLEKDGRVLVIDPGSAPFADATWALDDADAVLVTHQHADHLDTDALLAACAANDRLTVFVPQDMVEQLASAGSAVRAVGVGESFAAAGFAVTTVGGEHAEIHAELPRPENIGYVIDGGVVYHPGDALAAAGTPIDLLLVPVHAPWSKVGEVVDFVRAVGPARAIAIHDGLLNDIGLGLVDRHIGNLGGTSYERLGPADTLAL